MRKIKFRAWDKENNDMLEDVSTWTDDFTDMLNETLNYYSKFGNFELMQFTGSFDKNIKEIYEGDICNIWMSAPWDEEVPIEITGIIQFEYSAYWFKGIESNSYDDVLNEIGELEVIGNIYENAELMVSK